MTPSAHCVREDEPGSIKESMKVSLERRCRLLLLLLLVACDGGTDGESGLRDPGAPSDLPSAGPAPELDIPADAPLVAFLGDSLSAGLHLARHEAFPAVLQARLAGKGTPFRIVNAGVSGSTTAGGLARVDWILRQKPDVVVVQLGANDGFRGIALATIEENLRAILRKIAKGGARAVLLEMRLPPNYGKEYAAGFKALYARVARAEKATFVSFFMDGVAGVADMNLPDGIHPTPAGHRRLAANLSEAMANVLR
jgi:acyl-CoA thioesterase-1